MATIDYNEIINNNMGLIKWVVKKFRPKNRLEYDQMIQEGRLGIWRAAQKHEPEKGALTTIAVRRIIWEICAFFKQKKKDEEKSKKDKEKPSKLLFEHHDNISTFLPENLTKEEQQIIRLLYEGNKKVEIYRNLGISQTKFNNILKAAARKIKRANKDEKNIIL